MKVCFPQSHILSLTEDWLFSSKTFLHPLISLASAHSPVHSNFISHSKLLQTLRTILLCPKLLYPNCIVSVPILYFYTGKQTIPKQCDLLRTFQCLNFSFCLDYYNTTLHTTFDKYLFVSVPGLCQWSFNIYLRGAQVFMHGKKFCFQYFN